MSKRTIHVYADWHSPDSPVLMGFLYAELLRGKEIFSFEYSKDWLKGNLKYRLDPDLEYYSGIEYLNDVEKSNFGLFLDSSPDRWGRLLMKRRESAIARFEQRKENKLFESDFLLGVYDANRMGALRFKTVDGEDFLDNNKERASPPWTSIRELEQISLKLEHDAVSDDPDYLKWLNMLVAPGSSLGGARPKASIIDADGQLWIAKFPSNNDFTDQGAWEMLVQELAIHCGINMSKSVAKRFSSRHHTYLTKRFDRKVDGTRIHFASAMTLLGRIDGDDAAEGLSYVDIVDFITTQGANANADLEQLWLRIVFNICVSNTDDHLRNHGFLLVENGWQLSPAYDINPIEDGQGLKLNINENDNALDLNLAFEMYPYFRLKEKRALELIKKVKSVVANWRLLTKKFEITKADQEIKAKAFENFVDLN